MGELRITGILGSWLSSPRKPPLVPLCDYLYDRTMAFVDSEGIRVYYDDRGLDHRVLVMDWRGHGRSQGMGWGESFARGHPWFHGRRLEAASQFPPLEIPDKADTVIRGVRPMGGSANSELCGL